MKGKGIGIGLSTNPLSRQEVCDDALSSLFLLRFLFIFCISSDTGCVKYPNLAKHDSENLPNRKVSYAEITCIPTQTVQITQAKDE